MTKDEWRKICRQRLADRERARTDLYWLANVVLSPADSRIMVPHAHGAIVDHCQQFAGRHEIVYTDNFQWKMVKSQPRVPMNQLKGSRQNLLLVSRGHLKTTIHTIAHCIQWIINYEDVRILICTSTDEKASMIVGEMKSHFQFNAYFRFLFPEFCPDSKKVSDFGSKTEFTVPNRKRKAKEPTVMTASVGKALASTHHDVIKCTDVVTENNVHTDGQIREVKEFFGYIEPLRERFESLDGEPNPAWKDVEGTLYHFADKHQDIIDSNSKLPEGQKDWKITQQSCWVDEKKSVPLWPERFPVKELQRLEREIGPVLFAAQYELNQVRGVDGLASLENIKFFPAHIAAILMPRYRIHTTIDCANMDPNSLGDYTVITTCGFDQDGRCDVLSISRGHFTDEQFVDILFVVQELYPSNIDFKVQKDHISSTLGGYLRREQAKRGKFLNIHYLPNSGRGSKSYRIIKGLQGWFMHGIIRFSDAISCKNDLIMEILRFPKGKHDDILDTLADQFENRDGEPIGDVYPNAEQAILGPNTSFTGFDPMTAESRWLNEQIEAAHSEYNSMTGAL